MFKWKEHTRSRVIEVQPSGLSGLMSLHDIGKKGPDVTLLLLAYGRYSQHTSHRLLASFARGAEASLAPQDSRPQSTFGGIAGRLDSLDDQVSPHGRPHSQYLATLVRLQRQGLTQLQQLARSELDEMRVRLQRHTIDFTSLELMPVVEQLTDQNDDCVSSLAGWAIAFTEPRECRPVAFHLRPTRLPAFNRQRRVVSEAVGGNQALARLAQQGVQRFITAAGDHEYRAQGTDSHPQPASLVGLFRTRFINMRVGRGAQHPHAVRRGDRQRATQHPPAICVRGARGRLARRPFDQSARVVAGAEYRGDRSTVAATRPT